MEKAKGGGSGCWGEGGIGGEAEEEPGESEWERRGVDSAGWGRVGGLLGSVNLFSCRMEGGGVVSRRNRGSD